MFWRFRFCSSCDRADLQRLEAMEGAERERLRLEVILKEERELRSTLNEEANASRKVVYILYLYICM